MRALVLVLLALVLPAIASAQVVTCADATVEGKPFQSCGQLVNTTTPAGKMVLWCAGGNISTGAAQDVCMQAQWLRDGSMQSYSWTWTLQGWQRHGSMVFTPAPQPSPPQVPVPPTVLGNGSVLVSWLPPTTNVDQSVLTDLAGFRVRYGTTETALNTMDVIYSAGRTSTLVIGLNPGLWYFGVEAFTADHRVSDLSDITSRRVEVQSTPPPPPDPAPEPDRWVVAQIAGGSRPIYEVVLNAAGNSDVRGQPQGYVDAGKPCGSERFRVSSNSYRDVAESDVRLDSPTYRGRSHVAICAKAP